MWLAGFRRGPLCWCSSHKGSFRWIFTDRRVDGVRDASLVARHAISQARIVHWRSNRDMQRMSQVLLQWQCLIDSTSKLWCGLSRTLRRRVNVAVQLPSSQQSQKYSTEYIELLNPEPHNECAPISMHDKRYPCVVASAGKGKAESSRVVN